MLSGPVDRVNDSTGQRESETETETVRVEDRNTTKDTPPQLRTTSGVRASTHRIGCLPTTPAVPPGLTPARSSALQPVVPPQPYMLHTAVRLPACAAFGRPAGQRKYPEKRKKNIPDHTGTDERESCGLHNAHQANHSHQIRPMSVRGADCACISHSTEQCNYSRTGILNSKKKGRMTCKQWWHSDGRAHESATMTAEAHETNLKRSLQVVQAVSDTGQ